MPQLKEQVFKDLPISLTPHPVTGRVNALVNERAVKEALKNLILTNRYERFYEPLFGGDVISHLFENFDQFTLHKMKKRISTTIENFEPRVEIHNIRVTPEGDQAVSVTIEFRVINTVEPTEVTFLVERTR